MKVIDLLNMIANGEEMPKKIKYDDGEFCLKYDRANNIRYYETEAGLLLLHLIDCTNELLDEVEILDDKIDIEELPIIEAYECDETDIKLNRDKINELVKAINAIIRRN